VTLHNSVATSVGGDEVPGRGKGGDDTVGQMQILTGPKNEENSHGRFSCYKMDGEDLK
jgi:hypothetical protein